MTSAVTPLIQDAIHVSPRVHVPYFTRGFYHSIRMPNWVICVETGTGVRMRVINEISHHLKTVLISVGDRLVQKFVKSRSCHRLGFAASCNEAGKVGKDVVNLIWGEVINVILNKGINNCYILLPCSWGHSQPSWQWSLVLS